MNQITTKKNLADYYPVYKETGGLPTMVNAEDLIVQAKKLGFNLFQTTVLLVKNSFEGHVLLNFDIRPDELYSEGTIILKATPELYLLNFYENFAQYIPGLVQCKLYLQASFEEFEKISFESLIYHILSNHIIRLPVSVFSTFDIQKLNELPVLSPKARDLTFELLKLGERFMEEQRLVAQVNEKYLEKFSALGQQIRLKEEVYSHYKKKVLLAPFVNSEEALDELMYQKLIEEKLNATTIHFENLKHNNMVDKEGLGLLSQIREKMKLTNRTLSKNCAEVHISTEIDDNFQRLNETFIEATSIYNDPVSGIPENFLNYMQLTLLLSELLVFRKSTDLTIVDSFQLSFKSISMSKEELKLLEINLEEIMINHRIKYFTDYKMKFVLDDELTEMHKHFLRQQIEYIDNQILQIQADIKEILKMKSQIH